MSLKSIMRYVKVRCSLPEAKGAIAGRFVSNGTADAEWCAEKMAENRPNVDAAAAAMVIGLLWQVIADVMLSFPAARILLGRLTFEPVILGSASAVNSPLEDGQRIALAVRLDQYLRNLLSDVVPECTSDDMLDVALRRVMDERTEQVKAVHGTDPFVASGLNICASGEGERLYGVGSDGVEIPAEILSESDTGQRIRARMTRALPAGKATLCLVTRGFGASEDETPFLLSVDVTAVAGDSPVGPAPEITNGYSNGHIDDPGKAYGGVGFTLEGSRFGTDAAVKIGYTAAGQHHDADVAPEEMAVNDTYIEIYDSSVALMAALSAGGTITFTVETDAGISNVYTAQVVS